jgi:hypothetical protein
MVQLMQAGAAPELDAHPLRETQRERLARDARRDRVHAHQVEAERVRASLLLLHRTSPDSARER